MSKTEIQFEPTLLAKIHDTETALAALVERFDYEQARAAYTAAQGVKKQIEASREEMKRPFLAAGKRVDELAKQATSNLLPLIDKIAAKIAQREREIREEQQRLEQERQRLIRIQQEQELERQRLIRVAAEQEAERARLAAEVDPFGFGEPEPAPVVEIPPPVVVDIPPPVAMQPLLTRANITYSVRVTDFTLIPQRVQVSDFEAVDILVLDKPAALRLLKNGYQIPGLELVKTEGVAATGRR